MGTVVIVIPLNSSVEHRLNAALLRPDSFEPFDNPSSQSIESIGGSVVRVNADGDYATMVESGRDYQVLIISKNTSANSNFGITKLMRAELGSFFLPLEDLLGNRQFHWQQVFVGKTNKELQVVIFSDS